MRGSLPRYALNNVQTKTDRQRACMQDKIEYLMMFHGREDSVKSTKVARNKWMSTDSSSQLERAAWQDGGAVLLPPSHRTRAARALILRKVDGTRPPNQRWASADLSQGPAYKSRPGLCTRQGPNQGAGLRQADQQTCRAVGVSRDRQRLRPLSFFL